MNRVRAWKASIRQVAVVKVAGRLDDVVEELDRAIALALAEGPRGVVADLSGILEDPEPAAVQALAAAGRHVRDWCGIPVAVACPDPEVRGALEAHPMGAYLIVAESMFMAVSTVLATPTPEMAHLRLAAHPTATRASREFVTRTLLGWRLGGVIPFANLVVSELVLNSSATAGTDMDLCVAWTDGALRLSVRDHGAALSDQRPLPLDLSTWGLTTVAGLARTFGVIPAAEGGKVVWAVLNAPQPQLLTRQVRPQRFISYQECPIFSDGRGLSSLPFCAGASRRPA